MSERPALDRNLDSKTFCDFYFLKEELVNFCRENGLPVSGGKIELADRIAYFLDTGKVLPASAARKKAAAISTINEDTKIEADFVCSEKLIKKRLLLTIKFLRRRKKEEAIKCWKYKKQLQGHSRYEKSDLIAIKIL